MGKILAICISEKKGTVKHSVEKAELIANHGIAGDAHAGNWHRQISLLSHQKIQAFREKGASIKDGDFGENLVIDGIDLRSLPVGTILECGSVIFEITQIGKECHSHCAIYNTMGDCIMPREGVFAKVIQGGFISVEDEINIRAAQQNSPRKDHISKSQSSILNSKFSIPNYRVWILTASDKGFKGEREDSSGNIVREIAEAAGYSFAGYTLLADEQAEIENELKRICDNNLADLILTTGGTGFSPRDCTPEATIAIADRLVPGIGEAMRAASMAITKRAMLSRATAVIRNKSLIVNLPGSPKAVRENLNAVIGELRHGLDVLTGRTSDCGEIQR